MMLNRSKNPLNLRSGDDCKQSLQEITKFVKI